MDIIIDTDPGSDDAVALAVAAAFFRDDIRALVSTFGNIDGRQAYRNLAGLARILRIGCPIFKGALAPLSGETPVFTDYHGANGLYGIDVGAAAPESGPARGFKDAVYIALGPLTNLAAGRLDSGCVSEIIIMGGGFDEFNMPHGTEYNFSMDAAAVKRVLASPLKKIIAPLDMTHKLALSLDEIAEISGGHTSIFTDLLYFNYETSVKHGHPGAVIHDAATLAYLIDPGQCELREYAITCDDYGAVRKNTAGRPVTVIEKIDRGFVKKILKETFAGLR